MSGNTQERATTHERVAIETTPVSGMTTEAEDAPRGRQRRIIHVFVAVLLFIIATSATPTVHPSQDVVRDWLDPFVDAVGLWQGQWALFGPEVDKINVAVVGVVEFADGQRAEWRTPNLYELAPSQKFRFFRLMEFTDGIRRDANQGAWPALAEYVVGILPHPTDSSVRAMRVSLWRQYVILPEPRAPLRPIADPFPLTEQELFFSRILGE